MSVWLVVIFLGLASIAIKAAGPVALGDRKPPESARRVLLLVSPVVLTALIVMEVFRSNHYIALDAKAVGLGVAAVALLLRAPLVVVVISAVAATAGARALLG